MLVLISVWLQLFHFFFYPMCSRYLEGTMRVNYTITYFLSQISVSLSIFRNTLHEALPMYFTVSYNIILLYYEYKYATNKTKNETDAFNRIFREWSETERKKMDQTVCSICLDELTPNSVSTRSCTHLFHRACIERWIMYKDTCPYCRSII